MKRTLTEQLVKQQETNVKSIQQDMKYLKEVIKKDETLGLGGDTYAMAFKAFNWQVIKELDLNMDEVHNSYHAAMFVFGFQCLMIFFIGTIIFSDGFTIVQPTTTSVMGARFICSILMHLQVESDMRQGLRMMKYVTNHPFDFSNPMTAFFVALMQCIGGLFAEIACILFLCSINSAIDVIIKFVALASIAKVDDIYASALPADGNKIKKKSSPLVIRLHKRDWELHEDVMDGAVDGGKNPKNQMEGNGINRYIGRFIFKGMRMLYCSLLFYFLPYTTLFIPNIAVSMRVPE